MLAVALTMGRARSLCQCKLSATEQLCWANEAREALREAPDQLRVGNGLDPHRKTAQDARVVSVLLLRCLETACAWRSTTVTVLLAASFLARRVGMLWSHWRRGTAMAAGCYTQGTFCWRPTKLPLLGGWRHLPSLEMSSREGPQSDRPERAPASLRLPQHTICILTRADI